MLVLKQVMFSGRDRHFSSASLSANICHTETVSVAASKHYSVYQITLILLDQIHLVQEAEDLGVLAILKNCLETRLVVVHILFKFA